MSWNYRVMRHEHRRVDTFYQIHEVYYDEDGNVNVWTKEGVVAHSDTAAEMRKVLSMMEHALSEHVLDSKTGKVVEGTALAEDEPVAK